VRQQVLIGIAIIVRRGGRAARDPAREGCAVLYREAVEREVSGTQGQRLLQVACPIALQFGGQGKDQIERDIVDARPAQRPHGGADPCRIVGAMHPLQHAVVE